MTTIPVFRPSMDSESILARLRPVLDSGWIGQGPVVEEFERQCAEYVGAKHFVATSSGTAALHLAVYCLDLPPGSRILTSPITFVSTNAAILYCCHVPVFGRTRYGMLHDSCSRNHCAAAISVSLGGQKPMLAAIQDCSHAFGAPWVRESNHSRMRTWSFHAVKNLPMGDGGGVSTDDDELAARLRRLRWMGIDKSTHQRSGARYITDYSIDEVGFKAHLNDISAAIGLAMLPHVAEQNTKRLKTVERYVTAIRETCGYDPEWLRNWQSCTHFLPIFFEDREAVEKRCAEQGISYARHYKPNFMFKPFEDCPCPGRENAMDYYDKVLILPLFPSMNPEEIDRVVDVIRCGHFE